MPWTPPCLVTSYRKNCDPTPVLGPNALLPPGIHPATMDEIHQHFVANCPEETRERRQLIFDALKLHIQIIQYQLQGHHLTFWLDGGFTTQKTAKTRDADFVCFANAEALIKAHKESNMPLWTLGKVTASMSDQERESDKLHTFGGFTDSYIALDNEFMRERWNGIFSQVKSPKGAKISTETKGFVEVIGL